MRAVVQRVLESSVQVDGQTTGAIKQGLMVLLGIGKGDTEADAFYLAEKITGLRIFEDEDGKMNRSLGDIGGSLLAVSQFTLYGDCRKGRRPAFTEAAEPELAEGLYRKFCEKCAELGFPPEEGIFRADMKVQILNDGPVTLLLDSKKAF